MSSINGSYPFNFSRMDHSSSGEGPAILQTHKWGNSELPLNLSEYREAFISPTRELLLLLSYQCQALLLPLTTGGSVDAGISGSCHVESPQNLDLLASRSNLKDDIPCTSGSTTDSADGISLEPGFLRSNAYPFLCDVNSLTWGVCGDTYNQHKDGSFRELLFVSGNQGVMVHAFSQPGKSSVPGTMLEGDFRDGNWVEWGPSSSSFQHIKEEKPIDLSFEVSQSTIDKSISNGNLGVPDKISKKVEDDVLSGTGTSKRWLRSFFTKAETVEYEGGIWTRFPQKSSFPCSAKVVSFGIFTSNFPVLRFLCKKNSSSNGENCRETIRNLENGSCETVELDTSDVGSSTPYKCSRVFSSTSHQLIGFLLTQMNSASTNASDGNEQKNKNIIVISRLDIRGIQWVSLVKLPQNENTCSLGDWKDFHFSDDFLICLNASGLVFFYDTLSGELVARLDILRSCELNCSANLRESERSALGDDMQSKSDHQHGDLLGRRTFKRLLVASYTSLLAVVDEFDIVYVIYAGDCLPDQYYAFEKLLPHYQHLGLGMLVGWDVGSSDVSYQRLYIGSPNSCNLNSSSKMNAIVSFCDNTGNNILQKIHGWKSYGNGCLSDSVLNGFSAASKVVNEKFHDSQMHFPLMRKFFLPTDRYNDDDCIFFSSFGITRLIRRHNVKDRKSSQIVHFDLHTDSVVHDDRFLNSGSKNFSLQGREVSIGEAVGCTFQGCFYLVTDGGLSVVLPSVSVSSNLLPIETIGYQESRIGTGIGCHAKNILGLEEPKMLWSPWKVEILDRVLLYEGPEEADRLCLENGWNLTFSRMRRLQVALDYLKFDEVKQSLEMLVGVNLAEEGVLRLLFAAVYLMFGKNSNDNEISAASRLLKLATWFATKMIREYGLLQLKRDALTFQGFNRPRVLALPSVVPDKTQNEVRTSARLREMAQFLQTIRNLQYQLREKLKKPGQGLVDRNEPLIIVDPSSLQDEFQFSTPSVDSLETYNEYELQIPALAFPTNNNEKLALVPNNSVSTEAFTDLEDPSEATALIPRGMGLGKILPAENPKEMIARWKIDKLDLKTVVKDALLSGRLPLAVLQLHLHRSSEFTSDEEPHDTFNEVSDIGRDIAYDLFLKGEIELAIATLQRLGEDVDVCLKQLLFGTVRKTLRLQIAEEMQRYGYLGSIEWKILERISLIERLYPSCSFWKTFHDRMNGCMRVSSTLNSPEGIHLCLLDFFNNLKIECGEIDGVVLGAWANVSENSSDTVLEQDGVLAGYWAAAAVWSKAWDQRTIDRIVLDQPSVMGVHVPWESQLEYHIYHNDWEEVFKLLDLIPTSVLSNGSLQIALDGFQPASTIECSGFPDVGNYIYSVEELDAVCMGVPDIKIFRLSSIFMCSTWLRMLIEQELVKKLIFLKEYWEGTAEVASLLARSGFIVKRYKVSFEENSIGRSSDLDFSSRNENFHADTVQALDKLLIHYCAQNNLPNLLHLYLDRHKLVFNDESLISLQEAAGDCHWARWLLLSRLKGHDYDASFENARSVMAHNLIHGDSLHGHEVDDLIHTIDDIAEGCGAMAALATLMYASAPIQNCLSSGSVNRHNSSTAQCTLENLRPTLQHYPTLWHTLVSGCFGQDASLGFLRTGAKNALTEYLNWRDNIFFSTGRDTSLLQMLPCCFPKAVRRLIQLYVQISSASDPSFSAEVLPDSNASAVTCHKLVGPNYLQWSQSIKLYITGRGKLGYITGQVEKPNSTDPGYEKWIQENSMVMSWLTNTMTPSIGGNFLLYTTAKDIWDAAKETYSNSDNVAELFRIECQAANLKQEGMDVTIYYNTMTRFWQQIDLYESSDWTNAADAALYKKKVDQKRIFQFLNGLHKGLDDVKGRILSTKPLPSVREVFSEVRREESRRCIMLPDPINTDGSALLTHTSSANTQRGNKPWCDHCKRVGHVRDTCWKLHGKPADWKPQKMRQQKTTPAANATSTTSPATLSSQQIEDLQKLLTQIKLTPDSSGNNELKIHDSKEFELYCDNQSAISIAKNPGPLGWQSLSGLPTGESLLDREIDFYINADEQAEINAISWEATIQKHVEEELYHSSLKESGLGLEHHLHRGRALAAFNHLLISRVEKLKIEGRSNDSGQTNIQSDVQTHLAPMSEKEECLLSSVTPFAITHFEDNVLVSSCVFLLELCGLSASMLRLDVASLRRISFFYKSIQNKEISKQLSSKGSAFHAATHDDSIMESLARALSGEFMHGDNSKQRGSLNSVSSKQPSRALMLVLQHLEKASLPQLVEGKTCGYWLLTGDGDGTELRSQQKAASQHWSLVTLFCQIHQLPLSTKYIAVLARDNDWVGFLCEAQIGGYSFDAVFQVASKEFSDPRLKIHILTVLKSMQSKKMASSQSYLDRKSESPSPEENVYIPVELFRVLADCEKQKNPGEALLLKAKDFSWSILAMIASCFPDVSPLSCLTVWLEITAARETKSIKVNDIATQIVDNVAAAVEAANSLPCGSRSLSFHYNRQNPKRRRLLESLCRTPLPEGSDSSTRIFSAEGSTAGEERKVELGERINDSSDFNEGPASLAKMVAVLCEQRLFLPLLRAFELFLPSCSFLPFVRALQAFSQLRLSEASAHLGSFSSRIKVEPSHLQTNIGREGQIGISWISSTAIKAADATLSTCPSPYEKRCLLQLLAAADFGDGGSAAACYRRLYWKINLAEPSLRKNDDLHLGNETLDDASLLTALEENMQWEQARNWAKQLEASGGPWKYTFHQVTETQVESMVAEWKEFLWDVPEERVALWGHCQTLFIRYSYPALQAGLFFLKHAEAVEKDLPARELHEMLLLSLQWLSGMITQSNPVYPLHLLREIETRVWLLAVESEAQGKSEGEISLTGSSHNHLTGNISNIDRTANIITKMDNHINSIKNRTVEKYDAREPLHRNQALDSSSSTVPIGSSKTKRRAKGYVPSRRPMVDPVDKEPGPEDSSSPPTLRNDVQLQDESLNIEISFSKWEEMIGPGELERAVLSLLEFGQISVAKQLQQKLSPGQMPSEVILVDAALKLAAMSTPTSPIPIAMLGEELLSVIQSYTPITQRFIYPLQVLETLATVCTEGSGRGLCKKIIAVVKAANVLGLSFSEAFGKHPIELLQLLSLKAQESFEATNLLVQTHVMPAASIAQILAESFLKGLLAAHRGGYMDSQKEEGPAPLLWRFSDFLKWAELCPSEPEVGHALMRLVITGQEIPLACEVELLILSHHFYKSSSCLDGVDVLVALAATRVEAYVSEGDFACLARLITGVGNFYALNFILGILIENDQLDLLLQKYSSAADTTNGTVKAVRGFRMAVLTSLKHFNPYDLDAFAKAYNHFHMKHETASLLESRAEQSSMQWFSCYDRDQNEDLLKSMRYYIEAAEVHSSIDAGNKARRACAQACLVSLQIRIPDFKWLHLSETNARRALVEQSRFLEALIVAEAYGLNQPTEWALVLWNLMLNPELTEVFVAEFVFILPLQPSMLIELARFYRAEVAARGDQSQFSVWLTGGGLPAEWAKYLGRSFRCLLSRTEDLRLRLQLATSATGFTDVVNACMKALDRVPDTAVPLVLRKGHGGAYLPLM
ncbi:hypothetical protein GQ457_02G009710 [Hibiscus cannabinus]